jgi:hypothetical protein
MSFAMVKSLLHPDLLLIVLLAIASSLTAHASPGSSNLLMTRPRLLARSVEAGWQGFRASMRLRPCGSSEVEGILASVYAILEPMMDGGSMMAQMLQMLSIAFKKSWHPKKHRIEGVEEQATNLGVMVVSRCPPTSCPPWIAKQSQTGSVKAHWQTHPMGRLLSKAILRLMKEHFAYSMPMNLMICCPTTRVRTLGTQTCSVICKPAADFAGSVLTIPAIGDEA